MFNRQRARHELLMKKYPNRPDATKGPALTGIDNVREETKSVFSAPIDESKLPFDPQKALDHDLPWTPSDK